MKRVMRFDLYEAADGWRWRLRAANGRIIAESGEAYSRRSKCVDAIDRLGDAANDGRIARASADVEDDESK